MENIKPIVLILCGGKSLRLWPLSEHKSKNFLDIFGFSPLELTIKRFLKITTIENIFFVANSKEKDSLKKIKLIKKENVFFEPESKNTSAAILLSVLRLKNKCTPDRIIIISPVDHLIKGEKEFYSAIETALRIAGEGWICTLGITPQQPTPNFGYIQVEKKIGKDVFSIKQFIEKPTRPQAAELIRNGNSFYNSGMFIATLATLDREYKKYCKYYEDFAKILKKPLLPEKALARLYKNIDDIPFDRAIMELTNKVRLVKANFFWRDFGSWHAIYEALKKDKSGNVKKGNVFTYNSEKNLIYLDNVKKKVLVLGLKDVFFIDTGKYTLLTNRYYLDNLKPALKEFKAHE
ncbi:MAG: sugar phosphate nucleotidyltransferase [Candidatus Omnitrophota bacterium]